jgi:signal recognition particle receptor subunit beta
MEIMRLVVTGPVGAGKSTFIRSVSEIEVVDTDRQATDETADLKPKTTVAFDFGRLQFGPAMALHLYGTPGQSRFDFMWDILIKQAHAYVLLVAAHRPAEFRYARRIATFMNQRRQLPMVVGLTHTDCPNAWQSENIAIALGYINPQTRPPFITVNANEQASVAQAIVTLIQHSMQGCLV